MQSIVRCVKKKIKLFILGINPKRCGYLADTAYIARNCKVYNQENLYLYEGANLSENAIITQLLWILGRKFIVLSWENNI